MNKYKLTNESITICGQKLFRIEATAGFGNVLKGEKGGFVENENNLSQNDNAWVSDNAQVYGDARVSDNAQVYGDARVYGDAQVYGNAQVYGDARVFGDAQVYGDARVFGDALVYGDARVFGDALVFDNARVSDNAQVYGDAWVSGDAQVYGKIKISLGHFFGMRYDKEEIKYIENEGQEIICKGDIKIEKEDDKKLELLKKAFEPFKVGDKVRILDSIKKTNDWEEVEDYFPNMTGVINQVDFEKIGTNYYINGCYIGHEYLAPLVEQEVEELTMEEVCKLLGREVKIKK